MSSDEVVLISGAASGIGRRLSDVLLQSGRRVAAADINELGLDEHAKSAGWDPERALLLPLDVTEPGPWDDAIDAVLRRWGRLDITMNVAGCIQPGKVYEIDPVELARTIDVNLKGTMLGTRAAAAIMVKQGYGHIINIGSLASMAPAPGVSAYVASKFGVRGFTLAAALELKRHGVYVTIVMPDLVQTPMLEKQIPYDESALVFSGPAPLSVDEVVDLITHKVLTDKPLEAALPQVRGALAKIASVLPGFGELLEPFYRRKGLKNLRRMRNR